MCLMNEGRVKVYIDMSICLLYFSQRKSTGEVRNGHGGVEVGLNEWNKLTQKNKIDTKLCTKKHCLNKRG